MKYPLLKWSKQDAEDTTQFNMDLRLLLSKLKAYAAAGDSLKKFASGNTTGPDFTTIYGLMQCTPDLSEGQCGACLERAVNQFAIKHGVKAGGRTITPTCNFRYQIYSFFNVSTLGIPPPPPSSSPAPSILLPSQPVSAPSP
ncbi:putative cysteine-rich receptor-like protein kinase 9, partial [Bidens hawaiensis]